MTTVIQVLGSGCARCRTLTENATEAVKALGADARVEEVHDVGEIVARGILTTPALVVDDELVLAGRVPSVPQLQELLSARL